jgi:radical SAM superfamily enzyme YgiQ (UPF0313 family)
MKALVENRSRCLLVQTKFSAFSFWNYGEVCRLVGAKYPASPLGLITVAALLPQHWEFKLIDENVEPLTDEHLLWADLVCTGGMRSQREGLLTIIERAHAHGRPVVVGGPDPTTQPEVYHAADFLVLNEGEITIPSFLKDLAAGAVRGEYRTTERADITRTPVPRFDLLRFKDYIYLGIQFSRGCPYNCEFCDIIELFGRTPRTKTPAQVITELQTLYDLGYRGSVDFVDDNFIGNKKKVKEALPVVRNWSRMYRNPFCFTTEASVNLAEDDELLGMMKDADFRGVFLGIETPDDEVLSRTQKGQNVNRPIPPLIKKINGYGMIVHAGFILGFDNETGRTAEVLCQCIQDSGIPLAMLGLLYALPNTQLTRRLRSEGRLFPDRPRDPAAMDQYDQMTSGLNYVTSRPRGDILSDYARVLEHLYSPEPYFQRITQTILNLKLDPKYRPGWGKSLKTLVPFLKICLKLGANRKTARLYWKLLATTLIKNPKALDPAVSLAVMFIHFDKQARYIIDTAYRNIRNLNRDGEERFNARMLLHPIPQVSIESPLLPQDRDRPKKQSTSVK